jgi:hypothetical protein
MRKITGQTCLITERLRWRSWLRQIWAGYFGPLRNWATGQKTGFPETDRRPKAIDRGRADGIMLSITDALGQDARVGVTGAHVAPLPARPTDVFRQKTAGR